jgi:hypothetical protein
VLMPTDRRHDHAPDVILLNSRGQPARCG